MKKKPKILDIDWVGRDEVIVEVEIEGNRFRGLLEKKLKKVM